MNSSTQDKQSTNSKSESFGEKIRQAREEQQLSIDDLVRETRIHPQHLIDLERGKTSGISAPGYVVGYLKTLAKVLELDAEILIQDFKTSTNQDIHQTIDPEHELLPPKQKQAVFGWSTALATSIIVLAVIGALLYYWFGNMRDEPLSSSDSDVFDDDKMNRVDSGRTTPTPSDDSISSDLSVRAVGSEDSETGTEGAVGDMSMTGTSSDNNDAPPNGNGTENATNSTLQAEQTNTLWRDVMNLTQRESSGDASNETTSEPVENEDDDQNTSSETLANEDAEEATAEEPPLVFEFSDASWVEVTDADENQLISETKEAGTTLELDGKAPFTIKLGFAPGVTLYFNGSKVELESHTRRNTAELTLPP